MRTIGMMRMIWMERDSREKDEGIVNGASISIGEQKNAGWPLGRPAGLEFSQV
jgi:hypothetical protein